MSDIFDLLARVVMVIREDKILRETFNQLLHVEGSTQQVQTGALLAELERIGAPEEVKKFVQVLTHPELATQVLKQINA